MRYFADQSLHLTTANQTPTGVVRSHATAIPRRPDKHRRDALDPEFLVRAQRPRGERRQFQRDAGLVADPNRVDPGRRSNLTGPDISADTSVDATLGRLGDYHVYTFTPQASGALHYDEITVQATSGGPPARDPRVRPHRHEPGRRRLALQRHGRGHNLKAGFDLPDRGRAVDGNSTGDYNLTIDHIDVTKFSESNIQRMVEIQQILLQVLHSGSGLTDSTGSMVRDAQLSAPMAQEDSPNASLVDASLGQISATNHVQQIADFVATPPTIVKDRSSSVRSETRRTSRSGNL